MALSACALARGTVAPYGRYAAVKSFGVSWGAPIPGRLAWCVQELPSLLVPLLCLCRRGWRAPAAGNGWLLFFFLAHYFNRALVYPLRIRGGKPTPLYVAAAAFGFTLVNGYLQAGGLASPWAAAVDVDAFFVAGLAAAALGAYGNAWHDDALRKLRASSTDGSYKIPKGGLYEYVSGANFLCEILEWGGFACAARTTASWVFAACVVLNLGPRALHHHAWYREKFGSEYPAGRKALLPWVL